MFAQLKVFFGGKENPGISRHPSVKKQRGQRDSELEEKARKSLRAFAPELSERLIVGWNPRMRTTAGVAIVARSEVWLNPALREVSEEEVEKTLLHELAHLLAQDRAGRRRLQPHGAEWRQACHDLGIPGEGRTHQLPFEQRKMKRRYLLRCPACGESHPRVRLPKRRVACLTCCRRHHGGRYHERFRLEVQEIL
jgi:predicted SprT family Zn-dependent metalloprotease